jgi:hypothetical protein
MLRPHGYAVWEGHEGRLRERDTFSCAHCQRVVFVEPGHSPTVNAGWCGRCGAPVCRACAALGMCTPFERRLEQQEARDRFCRSIGVGSR